MWMYGQTFLERMKSQLGAANKKSVFSEIPNS